MKKLILIPMTLLLFACPSEDDNPPPPNQDEIIGIWKYTAYFENDIQQTLDPCELEETITFEVDGNYTGKAYEENANGDCILEDEASGTWENIGGNNYMLSIEGLDFTEEVFFEGNTFYLEFVDDFGTPSDISDDILVRDVYTKQ